VIRRRLFTVVSAISLLMLVGMLWLWVSSQFWGWEFQWMRTHFGESGHSQYAVRISYGEMAFHLWSYEVKFRTPAEASVFRHDWAKEKTFSWSTHVVPDDMLASGRKNLLGFSVSSSPEFFDITAPCWFPVLLTIVCPLVWIIRHRSKRSELKAAKCAKCGSSLTGNTSGVCPECGTPVPKAPAEKSPRPA
jgi:hypothetical protein